MHVRDAAWRAHRLHTTKVLFRGRTRRMDMHVGSSRRRNPIGAIVKLTSCDQDWQEAVAEKFHRVGKRRGRMVDGKWRDTAEFVRLDAFDKRPALVRQSQAIRLRFCHELW